MLNIFGFQESKIKPYLKMAVQRIVIAKNKKCNTVKCSKKEVANLIKEDKEEKARIRVEHIIRDDFTVEAMEILELMCELLHERVRYISSEKECPEDLKETISTVIWASFKIDIPELQQVRTQLSRKYGSKFSKEAQNNDVKAKVNIRVVEKLTVKPPSQVLVHRYMKSIAEQNGINWEPTVALDTETGSPFLPAPGPSGYSVPMAPASELSSVYQKQQSSEASPLPPAPPQYIFSPPSHHRPSIVDTTATPPSFVTEVDEHGMIPLSNGAVTLPPPTAVPVPSTEGVSAMYSQQNQPTCPPSHYPPPSSSYPPQNSSPYPKYSTQSYPVSDQSYPPPSSSSSSSSLPGNLSSPVTVTVTETEPVESEKGDSTSLIGVPCTASSYSQSSTQNLPSTSSAFIASNPSHHSPHSSISVSNTPSASLTTLIGPTRDQNIPMVPPQPSEVTETVNNTSEELSYDDLAARFARLKK
mmetsp:Transcript_31144/g.31682  ORF Transcript_31144/g.31682 Transcript_31144/m.31682 type:complete len:471 (-) Transcript_31144:212-1624(-)